MLVTAVVAACVGVAGGAGAEDLLGYGAKPCSHYTAARQGARAGNKLAQVEEIAMTSWAAGYLQAFHHGLVRQGSRGIMGSGDVMGRTLASLDRTCKAQPGEAFALAVIMAGGQLAGVKFKQ